MLRLGEGESFCGNVLGLCTVGVGGSGGGLASRGCALGFIGLDGPSTSLESEFEGAGRLD